MATPKFRISLSSILKLSLQKATTLPAVWVALFSFWLVLFGSVSVGISQDHHAYVSPGSEEGESADEEEFAESQDATPVLKENPPKEPQLQSNFAAQVAAGKSFVSQLDARVGRINRVFHRVLFYDFGTSRLSQFGAAKIERQSAKDYFGAQHNELFKTQVPSALTNFNDRYQRVPSDIYEAQEALTEAGLVLPAAPTGTTYEYDSSTSEFFVVPQGAGIPFIVAWLFLGGSFLTLRMRLISVRGLIHALAILCGKYDDSKKLGQLSHFRAFTTSLASSVGLGAISGVAVAVCLGGPGAAFWIMVCGLLAMSTKFTECTLGQIYRRVSSDGVVLGGPMRYLKNGFRLRKFIGFSMAPFGTLLAWLFAGICICVSLTAGNTFQVSQSLGSLQTVKELEFLRSEPWIFGVFMMLAVGLVLAGGARMLGRVTAWLAPLMCLIYIAACGWVIYQHSANLEPAFKAIFADALNREAFFSGSFVGVMIVGLTRASLTTDAGLGTASIAHAVARTDEPIREGILSMLEPLIVTVIISLLTALVIGVTGFASTPEGQTLSASEQGTAVMMTALSKGMPVGFTYCLHAATFLFAFSTCITWAYFGERCFVSLFGESFSKLYLLVFVAFTFLGSVLSAANIMQFSLLLMLTLAIPNLIGVLLLNGVVLDELDDYWQHYRSRKKGQDKSIAV